MALRAYTARMLEFLRRQPPLVAGQPNELDPRHLTLNPEAAVLWAQYADHVEGCLGPGQEYEPIRGFANKLPEHAARIAGVLTLADDIAAPSIAHDALYRRIRIAEYFASEALRLFDAGMVDPEIPLDEELLYWLQTKWAEPFVGLKVIYQRGPSRIRTAAKAKRSVAILEEHGWLIKAPPGTIVANADVKMAWQVIKDSQHV